MWNKIWAVLKKIILVVATFSIFVFLFQYLGAEDGAEVYFAICATILTIFLYGKHNRV